MGILLDESCTNLTQHMLHLFLWRHWILHLLQTLLLLNLWPIQEKLRSKKSKLETYGDMAEYLLQLFLSLGAASSEIHIIFDNYFDDSNKNYERFGRSTSGGKNKVARQNL